MEPGNHGSGGGPRRLLWLTRRRFLLGLGGAAGAAGLAALYMRFCEARWLEVAHIPVRVAPPGETPPAVRVAHLSDFHASPVVPLDYISEAITRALGERPDVIALTGDFITNHLHDGARYAEILRRLSAAAPTFACLGNHDGGSWTRRAGGLATPDAVMALLRDAGIACLHNAAEGLTLRGRAFQFIGVGDLWSEACEPATAFARTPARGSATRVLLNHNPDAKDLLRPFDWDVMLCGHTHGGQLRLPFLGTPFAPVVDKRFVEGLHRWQNRWMYITRGVGNLHGLRFNCRPQVSVMEIL
jgi:predicted MPP superfamily phosphohydrolase